MNFLHYVLEYFSAGLYAVLVFVFFGLGVAIFGFMADSGIRSFLVSIIRLAILVGLMFACIGLGTYFAKSTGIPVLIGIAGGCALFYGLAICYGWLTDRIQEKKRIKSQNATSKERSLRIAEGMVDSINRVVIEQDKRSVENSARNEE